MRMKTLFATACTAAALFGIVGQAQAETIEVQMDYAKVIRAPEGTATLVVGNPAIADTAIQRNNIIVLTGKSYGTTNILALDVDGATIEEMTVTVTGKDEATLTVHRGMQRESYSCAPTCEQTLRLGDSADHFSKVSGQFGARNGVSAPAER